MSVASYFARHTQAGLGSLGRILTRPIASFMTILVLALALSLPLGLAVLIDNAEQAAGELDSSIHVTLYFKADVDAGKARALAGNLRKRSGVAKVELITAERGLEELGEFSGFGSALEALGENPLPQVLTITPADAASTPADIEALRSYLVAWPEVDVVQVDTDWVKRLHAALELVHRALLVAALMLGLAVLAVMANTIRLEIGSRRAEIEVTKLVGGSNAFVRRPFLYTGALFGAFGGLLAIVVVMLACALLRGPTLELALLYGSRFELTGPGLRQSGIVLGAAALLGWLGAYVAAARYLREIEPRA
ncbi:MAG: permease-like cell division protein FtsX [Steroidobacteraceae bacterium]